MIGFSGSTRLAAEIRVFTAIAGTVATVAFISYATGLTGWFGSGGTQRLIIYPILIAIVVAGVSSGRVRASAITEPEVSDPEVARPHPVTTG